MKRLEKIIKDERNIGLDFIVHIQNKNELEDLIEVLKKLEFKIQLSLKEQTLREWMEELSKEENYDTCFRIRNREDDKCVAYNPSVKHWRIFIMIFLKFAMEVWNIMREIIHEKLQRLKQRRYGKR